MIGFNVFVAAVLSVAPSLIAPAYAATILKHMYRATSSSSSNPSVSGPLSPQAVSDGIDARQAVSFTSNITEVQSSYSQPEGTATTKKELSLLLPESEALQNFTMQIKTARLASNGNTPLDIHVNQFLSALPPAAREAPLAPQDVGKILFTMYNLQKAVKQARLGNSIMTPLLISQLVPPLEGPAVKAWLAGNAASGAASLLTGRKNHPTSSSSDSMSALARQLNVNLNMKEMMPLLAQFLDTSVKEKCGGNSTAAAEANSDTTALLSMMTQMIQKQEQHQQTAVDKEKEKEKEKKKNPTFLSQEFINEFFTGGNNGVNIQRMMMEIATKVMADVASKALTGG